MTAPGTCTVQDCDRPAERAGICAAHRKRLQRLGHLGCDPIRDAYRSPWERLCAAALHFAETEEQGYEAAKDRLTAAARAYVKSSGRVRRARPEPSQDSEGGTQA